MELEYKPDFDEARRNWDRFWEGRLGRPALLAIVPKKDREPVPHPPFGAARYQDVDRVIDQVLRWADSHEFLLDAVPRASASLMVNPVPAMLGAEVIETRHGQEADTAIVPFIQDLGKVDLRLQPEWAYGKKQAFLEELLRRRCLGRLLIGGPGGTMNLDTLAGARGLEDMLMDFYDDPEGVHRALRQISRINDELTERNIHAHEVRTYGSPSGLGLYYRGLIRLLQCDVAFNIGREQFDEFALPALKEEVRVLDYAAYHLDGEGNLKHLESVCSIDKIKIVQWQPGSGNRDKDWTSVYEKIVALGKGVYLHAHSPGEARELWRRYGNSGWMVLTVSAQTREEALRYLDGY